MLERLLRGVKGAAPGRRALLQDTRLVLEQVAAEPAAANLLHGATGATNAALEREGAPVGLVTLDGFRVLTAAGGVVPARS